MRDEVRIREARSHADYRSCVELQRAVWGLADLDVTSEIQLVATVYAGGSLLLAETAEGRAVGFCYGFLGRREDRLHLHSDMAAVLPEHQGRGIGLRLKWAQRDAALARGIDLVEWTFDPLQARNAHLNLCRLGAFATELLENFYGITSSALHHGLPTDRLLVRWELHAPRVVECSRRGAPPRSVPAPDWPRINEVEWAGGWPVSSDPQLESEAERLLLEIPPDWDTLGKAAPRMAQDWHAKIGTALKHYLARGYRVVDFAAAEDAGRRRPLYVIEKPA